MSWNNEGCLYSNSSIYAELNNESGYTPLFKLRDFEFYFSISSISLLAWSTTRRGIYGVEASQRPHFRPCPAYLVLSLQPLLNLSQLLGLLDLQDAVDLGGAAHEFDGPGITHAHVRVAVHGEVVH